MNRPLLHAAFPVTALAASAFAALIATTPARAQGCIEVEVQHVRPGQGALMIAVYTDAASFNQQPAMATQLRAGEATMKVPLCGIAATNVALTLYQDVNRNGKLDRNAFGVPSEPWGASGKVTPMTAPSWDGSAVAVDGKPIVVQLSK